MKHQMKERKGKDVQAKCGRPVSIEDVTVWTSEVDCLDCAPLVTKTGRVLTDADIEALADEAGRGYCVTRWGPGNSLLCGLVMPCPIHQRKRTIPRQ